MNNVISLMIQTILILFLFAIIFFAVQLNRNIRLEKRFKRFTFDPLVNDKKSLIDWIKQFYFNRRDKLSKRLLKYKSLVDYSKKYVKYCEGINVSELDKMNFVSNKIYCGLIGIILIVISSYFQSKNLDILELLTGFLLGFFTLDIYLIIKYKVRKQQIEKELIKAIIIMNNAFKSGLSIMQAIYLVSNELEGPISEEFKKMYVDLNFGLSMEAVFERFTRRVDTKEAHYITTSLSVLNKTGGNIVQVFASVERNAFTRKKLQEELGALAASSNAIFKILVVIPIFLFIIIFTLNPAYFMPLINTPIGLMITFIIILLYVVYIIIIRKVVKVKVEM